MGFDEEFKEIQNRIDRIIRNFFPNRFLQIPGETWSPPMDIYETEEHLVIVVELPGASSENLRISVEGGRLRISGKRDSLADSSHTKCHQIEIDSGFFQKQIYIPFEVDKDSATSHYKDGLLKIVLPKVRQPLKKKLEISLK